MEALLTLLALGVILSALIAVLSIADTSRGISIAKVDLQASVRETVDAFARDVRQTISWDIANNNPSGIHIKFRQAEGWNTTTDTLVLGANYIEYDYDANSGTLTRNITTAAGATLETREFHNLTQTPFYTLDLTNSTVVALNQPDLLNSRRVVIVAAGQAQTNKGQTITCTLTEEIKVRNE